MLLLATGNKAQDEISDKVDIKIAGEDVLDSLMIDSTDDESMEEENVTEMEDVTMTTPITTPTYEPKDVGQMEDDESRLEPNLDDEDELGKSLEINTDMIEVEVPSQNNLVENEVEEKSFGNSNGWFYFSNTDPKLTTLYHSVQEFPSASPSNKANEPMQFKLFIPYPWSLPQQWAAKPKDLNSQKTLTNQAFFPTYPVLYYSYHNKV